ncbi:unannotated protein [freshwater metagenome]|uniref:Unannotated protein n=1 Tax=freshwater metagenome TaxID=449393 RepID=A0A6J7MUF9_9ZZZZ
MQGEAGLEAQRVAGAEPGRRGTGREERVPHCRCMLGSNSDLDPVLAGISGASHHTRVAVPPQLLHGESIDLSRCGEEAGKHLAGRRALHRDHGARGRGVDGREIGAGSRERRLDAIGVGRVGHDLERGLVEPPHDDVVDDRGVVGIEEVGVLRTTRADTPQVVREGQLQLSERVGSAHQHGAQMADVEHHGRGAAASVLGDGAVLVGEWHVPSAEGHHLRAQRAVRRVERRVLQLHSSNATCVGLATRWPRGRRPPRRQRHARGRAARWLRRPRP